MGYGDLTSSTPAAGRRTSNETVPLGLLGALDGRVGSRTSELPSSR